MEIIFRNPKEYVDILQLTEFLGKQSLGYVGYDDWVEKVKFQLDTGSKKAVIAYSEDKIVGDILYQPHRTLDRVREVKNIRVHPDMRWRDFARFMHRQVEFLESHEYDYLMADAPADNKGVCFFLEGVGYVPVFTVPLYEDNSLDIVYVKPKDPKTAPESDILVVNTIKEYALDKALYRKKDF
ncbi:MAG: hypothetical protein ACLFTH_01500 [Candidatus Woesearchaeota archaeon]